MIIVTCRLFTLSKVVLDGIQDLLGVLDGHLNLDTRKHGDLGL